MNIGMKNLLSIYRSIMVCSCGEKHQIGSNVVSVDGKLYCPKCKEWNDKVVDFFSKAAEEDSL